MPLFQISVLNKYLTQQDKQIVLAQYNIFKTYFLNLTIQQNIIAQKEEQFQEGFLRELFVKVLGYTINPEPNYNLTTELKNEKDAKKTDGAIVDGANVLSVIELKSTKTTDLNKIEIQAFNYKNNQAGCRYVITSNFHKLRFYIDNAIDFIEWDLFKLSIEDFQILYLCLCKENVLAHIPATIKTESIIQEESITKQLYKEYSSFRKELFTNIAENNTQFDKLILFKKTQKLLDRFLFLFFAEDRNLLPPNSVRMILEQWTNLKEMDAYAPLYNRFKLYFGYLNTGHKGKLHDIFAYNGGLFAPDEILDYIAINDEALYNSTLTLSKYDYNSEIDVNILGHIFEHSLTEIEELEKEISNTQIVETKTSKRKKDGVFYTPKYITKYIVENTIGTLCKNKKEELGLHDEDYHTLTKKEKKKLYTVLETYKSWLLQITIIDPACGSGAFLNQALEFLISEHKAIAELEANITGSSIVFDIETTILENNIFGVDINEESVEIAKLSLWLRTAQKGRKLNSLNNNIKCGNSLIDDPAVAGDKAFKWQNEFPHIFEKGGFDVVIGNPPYVVYIKSVVGENTLKYLFEKYEYSQYNPNTYAIFTELALEKLLKQNSELGFIIPNSWVDNKYFSNMRSSLYDYQVRQIVNLKATAFAEIVETVILIATKKMDIKTDVKILPYFNENNLFEEIFQKEKLRAGVNPFTTNTNSIVEKLEGIKQINEFAIVYRGLETRGNSEWITTEKNLSTHQEILLGRDVNKYQTNYSGSYVNFIKKEMKSNANEEYYKRDKILMRRTGNHIIADIDLTGAFALKNLYLIIPKNGGIYSILAQLNSKLFNYYHVMKTSGENKAFAQFKGEYVDSFPCKIQDNKENDFKKYIEYIKDKYCALKNSILNLNKMINIKLIKDYDLALNNILDNDFDFLKELTKQKIKLSLQDQSEWLTFFEQEKQKAVAIKNEIDTTDKLIDTMVYELYGLSEEEIKIVEGNG